VIKKLWRHLKKHTYETYHCYFCGGLTFSNRVWRFRKPDMSTFVATICLVCEKNHEEER